MRFDELELFVAPFVYEPSDDSYLLAKYCTAARGRILDMGTGCGICALTAAKASKKNNVLAVDINPAAIKCAKQNAEKMKIKNISFLVSNLFSKVPKTATFDLIIFNPPYLPTAKGERLASKKENAAYDGGKTGRKVIDRFLGAFGRHLAKGGSLLLLDSSLSNTAKTIKTLEQKGFAVEILERRRFFFERLSVLLAQRNND